MHLCVVDPTGSGGQVVTAQDGVTCASLGYADYLGPMSGYPPLTVAEMNALATETFILWATCFGLRLIRRLIPKGIG